MNKRSLVMAFLPACTLAAGLDIGNLWPVHPVKCPMSPVAEGRPIAYYSVVINDDGHDIFPPRCDPNDVECGMIEAFGQAVHVHDLTKHHIDTWPEDLK